MNIQAPAFNQWLEALGIDATLQEICTKAGLSLSTVSEQRSGNRITPKTVIAISRAYGANPVRQLATFEGYETLQKYDLALSDIAPLYSVLEVIHQSFIRQGKALPATPFDVPEAALKQWVHVNQRGLAQKVLAQHLGMQPSNFSHHMLSNSMPVHRIMKISTILDISPLPGLVAAGYLTFEEVFGSSRGQYLDGLNDKELLEAVGLLMSFLHSDVQRFMSS